MLDRAETRRNRRSPYFNFFADDWISGTAGLTFEERGFFIQVLSFQWSRRAPLPLDLLPAMLACDGRQCRRLTARLIALGKLEMTPEGLSNPRLAAMLKAQELRAKSARSPAEVGRKSAGSPAEVPAKLVDSFPENSTKTTNPCQHSSAPLEDLPFPSPEPEEERKIDYAPPPAFHPEPAGGLAGLNGATTEIVETLAVWINPMMPDRRTAVGSLTTLVACHGSEAVKAGFAELKAKLAAGDVVTRPIPLLTRMVEGAKTRSAGPPAARRLPSIAEQVARASAQVAAKRAAREAVQ